MIMLKTKPKQAEALHRLARDECCNCENDNCLLLDDGDSHPCVQLISIYGVYCKYFRDNVLPLDEKLYAQIIEQNKRKN